MAYHRHFQTRQTPQSEPIPGKDMVENWAGGYTFQVDDWTRLRRFLVLGAEGGSYYASEQELTVDNAEAALRCIQTDGVQVVQEVVAVSTGGRAPKNTPALFVLAMCAGMGDMATRKAALAEMPKVARTGTHLFQFVEFVQAFRGWGRALRRAVGEWYQGKEADRLAYQVVKYRQREGWAHADLLRLAHPKPADWPHDVLYKWAVDRGENLEQKWEGMPRLVIDFEELDGAKTEADAITAVGRNPSLSWEMVPSEFLGSPKIWAALLPNMPMTATFRNLARMTANGLLKPMSNEARMVAERLVDEERLRKARVHPIQVLSAMATYSAGRGARGSLTWEPVREIVDALDAAFYLSFGNVEPTGKRVLLALDVSASMEGAPVSNVPGLTCRVGAAAMSLVTAAVEQQYATVAFSAPMGSRARFGMRDSGIVEFPISPRERLDDVVTRMQGMPFAGTDCALPMLWALEKGIEADAFVVYTDNQTWAGKIHPVQALRQYREKTGISARLVVVAFQANPFTIADPDDGGMMDVVGFDTAAPNLISNFVAGRI
jgi:60 kDa SS-A/Ro ribonucleoprotein